MSINWVTFAAQILNFVILMVLLYKFLYKPLLDAIDAREAKISGEVRQAESTRLEASKRLDELNAKHDAFENERQNILKQAHKVADELKSRLEMEVRDEAMETRKIWKEELKQEKSSLEAEMREEVIKNFAVLARKSLKDLAGASLESQVIAIMEEKIQALSETEKRRLFPTAAQADIVHVYSSRNLAEETKDEIKDILIKSLGFPKNVEVAFEINKQLLCGVEISVNGSVLSWNLDTYVQSFIENMNIALTEMSLRLAREES